LTKNELSYYADRTVSVFLNVHEIETLLVIDMPERLSKDSVSSQRILPSFRRLRVCYSLLKYACNNYIINLGHSFGCRNKKPAFDNVSLLERKAH